MVTRSVTAVLWFLMAWAGGNALAIFAGTPALLAPVIGVAVGALIWADPTHHLWDRRLDRKAVRRRIADLERISPASAPVPLRQEPASTSR